MLAPLNKYFLEVARQGSIRRASEHLHIAASAINRHILEFEAQLGTPLFERLPRGLRLTPAGEVMFDAAKRMHKDYAAALSEVDLLQQARRGHVTIGTLQSLSVDFFPPLVAQLVQTYPGITYSFAVGTTEHILSLVASGDADIGMCGAGEKGMPLRTVCSAQLPFGVVLRPDHPLAAYADIRLRDCRDYPLIYPVSGELRMLLDKANMGMPDRVSPQIETNSIPMLRSLVLSGAGVGFTSLVSVMGEVQRKELVFRPLRQQEKVGTTLSVFVHSERKPTVAAALFLEHLEEAFPKIQRVLTTRPTSR